MVCTACNYLDVLGGYERSLPLHNNHGPTNAAAITGNMHSLVVMIDVDTDEFADATGSANLAEA